MLRQTWQSVLQGVNEDFAAKEYPIMTNMYRRACITLPVVLAITEVIPTLQGVPCG